MTCRLFFQMLRYNINAYLISLNSLQAILIVNILVRHRSNLWVEVDFRFTTHVHVIITVTIESYYHFETLLGIDTFQQWLQWYVHKSWCKWCMQWTQMIFLWDWKRHSMGSKHSLKPFLFFIEYHWIIWTAKTNSS
jgi:hypothetical protein